MTTSKKKGAATAARKKPGPAARKKARAALAAAASAASAVSKGNTLFGRVVGAAAQHDAAKVAEKEARDRRWHDLEVRRVELENEERELRNAQLRDELRGHGVNVHRTASEIGADKAQLVMRMFDIPKADTRETLANEQERFDECQKHTADLVPRLLARLEPVLKPAVVSPAGGEPRPERHRSELATWVANRTARQADINGALIELLDRLDLE